MQVLGEDISRDNLTVRIVFNLQGPNDHLKELEQRDVHRACRGVWVVFPYFYLGETAQVPVDQDERHGSRLSSYCRAMSSRTSRSVAEQKDLMPGAPIV
jgi:hypothetical protein